MEVLKELIRLSGLNQKRFAKKHGIYEPNLSNWLNGKNTPKPAILKLIAYDEGYEIEFTFKLKQL